MAIKRISGAIDGAFQDICKLLPPRPTPTRVYWMEWNTLKTIDFFESLIGNVGGVIALALRVGKVGTVVGDPLGRGVVVLLAAAAVAVALAQRLDPLVVGHHRTRRLFSGVIVNDVLFADAPRTRDVTGTRSGINQPINQTIEALIRK